MNARLCMGIFALFLAGSSFSKAAEEDAATRWIRALARHDTDEIVSTTQLPFVFRTAGRDRTCEGRIRTKKALSAWATCVAKREDFRYLHTLLGTEGVAVQSDWAHAGYAKLDNLVLEIAGLHSWSSWWAVSVTYFWTTIEVRLLDRSSGGKISVGAMIMDMRDSHS